MSVPLSTTASCLDSGGSVLIADDDPLVRKSIAYSLPGVKVLEAGDGAEALEIIKREVPDLILLDEQMPGYTGVSVCRELRSRKDTAFTPVLLFTGYGGDEKKIEALEAGANEFMSKPLSLVELRVRVNNLLVANFHRKSLHQKNRDLEMTMDLLEESSAKLVRSERLLSMSRLSSGILHHLNNPLNHAKSALTLVERFLPDPENEGKECLETLAEAAQELDRVIAVVEHLRGFSQNENTSIRTFDLSRAIRSAIGGTDRCGIPVEIVQNMPGDLEFTGDLRLVSQIVAAIYQNALDAFSRREDSEESNRFEITLVDQDSFVEITFTDNGGGIDAEILPKVRDPFFTTKLSGSGAGLGLAFVEAVTSFFDGSLQVSSEGDSTTVKVRLAQS